MENDFSLICSHSWGIPVEYESRASVDKTVWAVGRKCERCKEIWWDGVVEPVVVVGRIRSDGVR